MSDLAFALTLNREVTPAETDALYEALDGDLELTTGPLGTVVEVYSDARAGQPLQDAISAAVRQVTTVIPRGWFIKTDGYG
jgi:hypothetical protein